MKKNDLGKDSIGKLIVNLTIPAITAQLINALYNIVDRIYIGRACEAGDLDCARRWTAYLLACRETRELRDEERNRGAAFTRLLADWQPD